MPAAFTRTTRALSRDASSAATLALGVAFFLLLAWAGWLLASRVPMYEVSQAARLEVSTHPHPLQAPLAGQVVSASVTIGREVKKGELLVELDRSREQSQVEEERTRLTALDRQLVSVRAELHAIERLDADEVQAAVASANEARARLAASSEEAAFAERELSQMKSLHQGGNLSALDLARMEANVRKTRAETQALMQALERAERKVTSGQSEAGAKAEALRREVARLEGEQQTRTATLALLERDVARRIVRAPVDGRIADAVPLQTGAVVSEGAYLATIVPRGALRAVAEFLPADAIGRLRPGQPAQIRLDAFPSIQYGTLPARVVTVAEEPREGRIRVELEPLPRADFTLQHGLTGQVEVEVERISPARLLLRLSGAPVGR